jgi:hypothetical protein
MVEGRTVVFTVTAWDPIYVPTVEEEERSNVYYVLEVVVQRMGKCASCASAVGLKIVRPVMEGVKNVISVEVMELDNVQIAMVKA